METNADNRLHHSFVANDASFGTFAFISDVILFGLPMYCYLQQILFLFYQPSAGVSLRGGRRGFPLLLRHVSPATFDKLFRVYRQLMSNRLPTLP